MTQVKASYSELSEKISEALKEAFDFNWNGWGVPVYVSNEGEVFTGGFQRQNTWTESDEFFEIYRVEVWNCDETDFIYWIDDANRSTDEKLKNQIKRLLSKVDIDYLDKLDLNKYLLSEYESYVEDIIDEEVIERTRFIIEHIEEEDEIIIE